MTDQVDSRGKLRSDYQTFFEEGSSQTVQSDAHLADIQEILKTFGVKGTQQMLDQVEGRYMDISEFQDYATMMQHVAVAEVEFMKLPSKVREKYKHSVHDWLDQAHDERRAPSERERAERAADVEAAEAAAAEAAAAALVAAVGGSEVPPE